MRASDALSSVLFFVAAIGAITGAVGVVMNRVSMATPSAPRVTACPFGGSTVNGAASVRRQLNDLPRELRSKNAGNTKSLTATPEIA